jgi:uncharacterized membrane protein YccC
MVFDPQAFYNTSIALVAGIGFAVGAMRLLPTLTADDRTKRLLRLTRRDLQRLARGAARPSIIGWEDLIHERLAALPAEAPLVEGARLSAALTLGAECIRLRRRLRNTGADSLLESALLAFAEGRISAAVLEFEGLARAVSASDVPASSRERLRVGAGIRVFVETMGLHRDYFADEDAA